MKIVTAFFVLIAQPWLLAQSSPTVSGDLAEVLGGIAVEFRVPIVAELASPLPHGFNFPVANNRAEELLNAIVAASPDYAWKWEGRVVHIYHRRLITARSNFLNTQFESFSFLENVALLNVTLRNALWRCSISRRMAADRPCKISPGLVFSGFWPAELETLRLSPHKVPAASARSILLEGANDSGQFYSIVVFPRYDARTPEDAKFAFTHWAWHPLSGPAKPFPFPFSYYGRIVRISPDVLLRNFPKHNPLSHNLPTTKLQITVDEHGRVEHVRVLDDPPGKKITLRKVYSWRFKPYHLNGLPAKVICDLPVEVMPDSSVRPVQTILAR